MKTLFIAVCLAVMCAGASASCVAFSEAMKECGPLFDTMGEAMEEYMINPDDWTHDAACSAITAVTECGEAKACASGEMDEFRASMQKTGFECPTG